MIYITVISILLFACLGAVLSRMDGGGIIKLPEWVDKVGVTFPYAIIGYMVVPWAAVPCMAFAWLGRALGHGGFFDLGSNPKEPNNGRDLERIEPAIYWLHDNISRFWYDFIGLMLSGLMVTIIPAMFLAVWGHYALALLMVLSGLAKAPSYALGRGNTEIGEYVNGFQQFLHAGVVIWGLYAASV